ncbi:MAG: polysaccharide deacetylase family protein [Fuerstiella sp.]
MTAVVSLTFDDALPEHLDFVAPLLNEHGFPGTFYVQLSSTVLSQRADEWAAQAARGHELGNHTVFHPADARKNWVTSANAIDDYTPERMRAELELANEWLQRLDGCSRRSFAYPCSTAVLGRPGVFRRMIRNTRLETTRVATWLDSCSGPGETRVDYRPLAAELFTACRSGGLTLADPVPPVREYDRFLLPSASVEKCCCDDIKHFVERGLENGSWPILQFHGVGGSHGQNCEPNIFRELIEWMAASDLTVETVTAAASRFFSS